MAYTVKLSEPGREGYLYVGDDLNVYPTADRCKPLTRDAARLAASLFREDAERLGRKIVAKVVILPEI